MTCAAGWCLVHYAISPIGSASTLGSGSGRPDRFFPSHVRNSQTKRLGSPGAGDWDFSMVVPASAGMIPSLHVVDAGHVDPDSGYSHGLPAIIGPAAG